MDVRIDGPVLCVRTDGRIPKVCLKCGATKEIRRHAQEFVVGANASTATGGAIIGVVVASVLRNAFRDEPLLQAAIVMLVLLLVMLGAWLASKRHKKVSLQIPLCPPCDERRLGAASVLVWILVGVVLMMAGVVVGIALGSIAMMVVGGLAFVAVLVGARAADIPGRTVQAAWAKDDEVGLKIDPAIAKKIVARAEKREKREAEAAAD